MPGFAAVYVFGRSELQELLQLSMVRIEGL